MAEQSQFDPQLIISHKFSEVTYSYTDSVHLDAALYALGIGTCAKDAVDDKELKYVYHPHGQQSIQVLPTFAALFALDFTSQLTQLPGLQCDPRLLLHGQQYIEIYKPLPSSGCILNKAIIAGLHDKVKAAVLEIEIASYEKDSGEMLCMNRMSVYLRGAGGFSKSPEPYSYTRYNWTPDYKIPNTQPFAVHEQCIQPSQALLYRLSGDYNPLHSDPKVAEVAGGEQHLIKSMTGRFLLHVYPGETLITEMWLEDLRVLYQVKVKERNRAVLAGYVNIDRLSSSL